VDSSYSGFTLNINNLTTSLETASGDVTASVPSYFSSDLAVLFTLHDNTIDGPISDYLWVMMTYSNATVHFAFASGNPPSLAALNIPAGASYPTIPILENESIGTYIYWENYPELGGVGGLNFFIVSDHDVPTVPLPPSLVLFGSGLLGLVGIGWRRRTG
jgi:hypothetical protein